MIPNSLVIEGMAQTGGLLVCEHNQFTEKVVLAKVPKAVFYCAAMPGDTLTYTTTIEYIRAEGAMVTATSYKGDVLHAEAEIVFAHLNDSRLGSLFDPETFLRMMRLLGAFDVGHAADGSPLQPPQAAGGSGRSRRSRSWMAISRHFRIMRVRGLNDDYHHSCHF